MNDAHIRVCERYYETQCGSCPLRPVCCAKVELSGGGFEQWQQKLYALAEEITRQGGF